MTISSPALTLRDTRSWLWAAIFVVGNILFPQICHMIPLGGKMLLPIMLFTLVATVRFGLWCGLITALFSPLVSLTLFGVPHGDMLAAVLMKSIVIALAFGMWRQWRGGYSAWSLLLLVVLCQLVCFPIEGGLIFGFTRSWDDLLISWPGMLLQWGAAVAVLKFWK